MLKLRDLTLRPDMQLGPMLVSPSRRLVEGPGGNAHLEPLTMQVFLLLLDARGKVVTRNELFDQCWGGISVGDDSLNRVIVKVRRTGVHIAPGLFEIETIPRTGYRLTGEITRLGSDMPIEANDSERRGRMSRRALIAGGAAAAVASAGLWSSLTLRTDSRSVALVEEADQILRYEYSERRLSAVPLLEEALKIEPGAPAALGLLAYARAIAATTAPSPGVGGADRAQAAERAIKAALDADANDPHARLALLLFHGGGFDWAATEDNLRQILEDAPRNALTGNWLVALYQAAGRSGLSWTLNEQLVRIDPISPIPQHRRALKHWIFGRTREADEVIERLIRIWPGHPWVWNARFLILAFTGRPDAALDMIYDSVTRPSNITSARMAQWRPTLAALRQPSPAAVAAAREANLTAARQSPGQAVYAVMALSGIGEIDAAFEVAEGFLLSRGKIVIRRPSDPDNMLVNTPTWRSTQWISTPPLAQLRADPRFGALCDGIGLTAYWRTRGIGPDYPDVRMA